MGESVQQRLAAVVHSVRYDDLPRDVVRYAKALILDSLGCALGGFHGKPAAAVRMMTERLGGTPEATIIGTGRRTSCAHATLANGTMVRYLDYNDYYFGRDPSHPSGNLPVALALAEREGRSGRDLIAALVAAYELHLRLCDCAGEPNLWRRGWHHSTNAQFSSAALAARLLSDDVAVTAHAMAIAATHHNTLAQLQSGGVSLIKATAEAWVAKGGVEAALLASLGMTGPSEIFEGKFGWSASVAGAVDFERLVRPIEGRYRLLDTCIKPYAAVATMMASIQAAIEIHRSGQPRAGDIESVRVRLPAFALGTPSAEPGKRYPKDRETADHSFHYCVAVGLLDGDCDEEQFTEEKLHSPLVREVIDKIELEADDEFSTRWPAAAGGEVAVRMRDGRMLRKRHPYPPGHPRNPLSDAQVEEKFHRLAAGMLSRRQASDVIAAVWSLDQHDHVGELMTLLGGK